MVYYPVRDTVVKKRKTVLGLIDLNAVLYVEIRNSRGYFKKIIFQSLNN